MKEKIKKPSSQERAIHGLESMKGWLYAYHGEWQRLPNAGSSFATDWALPLPYLLSLASLRDILSFRVVSPRWETLSS